MVQRVLELVKATNYKENPDVPRQEFLLGLITAVQALPDDEWEKLSEESQLWSNAATAAKRNNRPISDPASALNGEEFHVKHKTVKRAKNGRAIKTSLQTSTRSHTSTRASSKKGGHTTYSDVLFQTIWDDPKVSKDDLLRRIRKAGYNPTSWTVSAYSTRFRQAWKFFKRIGAIKRDLA